MVHLKRNTLFLSFLLIIWNLNSAQLNILFHIKHIFKRLHGFILWVFIKEFSLIFHCFAILKIFYVVETWSVHSPFWEKRFYFVIIYNQVKVRVIRVVFDFKRINIYRVKFNKVKFWIWTFEVKKSPEDALKHLCSRTGILIVFHVFLKKVTHKTDYNQLLCGHNSGFDLNILFIVQKYSWDWAQVP